MPHFAADNQLGTENNSLTINHFLERNAMASMPPDVVRSRSLIEGAGDERTAVSKLTDDKLLEYYIYPKSSPFNRALIKGELAVRSKQPGYAKKAQQAFKKMTEGEELGEHRHDVFDVDAFKSIPMPKGGVLGKVVDTMQGGIGVVLGKWKRMRGDQCVKIIDTNDNHKADDGDTCISRSGEVYPDAQFSGDNLTVFYAGKTCSNRAQRKEFKDCAVKYFSSNRVLTDPTGKRTGVEFEVHSPGEGEKLLMSLADESEAYGGRIKGQAVDTVKATGLTMAEDPVATTAALAVVGGLLTHPATRGPTLAVMNWIGAGCSVGGTGYLVYDRTTGIVDLVQDGDLGKYQENVGNYDFIALTSMVSGASAFKGVTVGEAARKTFYAPAVVFDRSIKAYRKLSAGASVIASKLFRNIGGGGGFAFAGAVGRGGALAIEADLAVTAAGVAANPASWWGGLRGLMMSVAAVSEAVVKKGKAEYNARVKTEPEVTEIWDGSAAAKSAGNIIGYLGEAGVSASDIQKVKKQIGLLRKMYECTSSNSLRQEIGAVLRTMDDELLVALDPLIEGGTTSELQTVVRAHLDRLDEEFTRVIWKVAQKADRKLLDITIARHQRIDGVEHLLDSDGIIHDIPSNVDLFDVGRSTAKKDGLQSYLNRALRFFANTDDAGRVPTGKIEKVKKLKPVIYKYKFNGGRATGAAVRVVFHQTGGDNPTFTILRVFINDHSTACQSRNYGLAARLAAERGLQGGGIGILTFDE